jgi:hypothetical protein
VIQSTLCEVQRTTIVRERRNFPSGSFSRIISE